MRQLTACLAAAAALLCAPAEALSKPFGSRTLERGDRGSDVRVLQKTLTRLGFRLSADGAFGRRTARAVRRYERRERIRVDGRVSRGQARGMFRRIGRKLKPLPRAAPASTGPSAFPVAGPWREGDGFGDRGGRHKGVDLLAACGTPLVVPEPGKVVFIGSHSRAGEYVVIRVAETGEDLAFMHLRRATTLRKGQRVAAGQRLGAVGDTGNASTCHLHFEIWTAPGWYVGGDARDPEPDLRRWAG